jgi:lipoprotein-releasing system ATP-binding protein
LISLEGINLPLLIAENLTKSYTDINQEIHILQGINLILEPADFTCISGQSGSGKSTLLHLLGLLDKPDSGKIMINDQIVIADAKHTPALRNSLIGFVFQFHYLMDDLNALENAALPLMVAGYSRKESLHKASQVLTMLGLKERSKHYPHQLSGGEQQRVALARALANSPAIILADEPTGNLDPTHSKEVLELMIDINSKLGSTFLIVSHDEQIALRSKSRYILQDGILHST